VRRAEWKEEKKSQLILKNATAVGLVSWPVRFITSRPLTLQIQASGFAEMMEEEISNFPSSLRAMAVRMRGCPYAFGSVARVALVLSAS
jgi:hypothetical protein